MLERRRIITVERKPSKCPVCGERVVDIIYGTGDMTEIEFMLEYRRKVFYGEKRREIGEILRTLCNWKNIRIIEAEVCPDHVHMLLEIPPKTSVSSFMGYLKGKSSLMIYEKFPELRYKYRNREFWCRGYYVDTAGKNAKKIEEYIRHQLDEDKAGEQLTMGNF